MVTQLLCQKDTILKPFLSNFQVVILITKTCWTFTNMCSSRFGSTIVDELSAELKYLPPKKEWVQNATKKQRFGYLRPSRSFIGFKFHVCLFFFVEVNISVHPHRFFSQNLALFTDHQCPQFFHTRGRSK